MCCIVAFAFVAICICLLCSMVFVIGGALLIVCLVCLVVLLLAFWFVFAGSWGVCYCL